MHACHDRQGERGFATIALIILLVPLMFLVGSYVQTMSGRQQRLQLEIQEEQALLTADSGIDYALNVARNGLLVAEAALLGMEAHLARDDQDALDDLRLHAGNLCWRMGATGGLSLLARWRPAEDED